MRDYMAVLTISELPTKLVDSKYTSSRQKIGRNRCLRCDETMQHRGRWTYLSVPLRTG